ncbi:peptidase inhibitor family I36 protein [Streptomyces sp. MNP-20]|uniref:peptidase inhibitor family I36 protein n=1 Tax=Streptomyces sp. MNP-20 TaxID=2721165 RepID=UPI0015558F58|nr:peptidase inhibitor family I36 protein [Streptomyces sp. MNP-20]
MRRVRRRATAVAVTTALTVGLLGVSESAGASQQSALPPASQNDDRPAVRALSDAQRQELQAEIESSLAGSKGGSQVTANEIVFAETGVILTLPLPGQARAPESSGTALTAAGASPVEPMAGWEGCPAGQDDNRWYCFYQHKDFEGRRLQWNRAHCQTPIQFNDYDFVNRTSSWVNASHNIPYWGMVVRVYSTEQAPDVLLWTERPETKVSYVGDWANDRANMFEACRR